jgi:uncharacterized protein DUF2334
VTAEERRSAGLLFWPEISRGRIGPQDLDREEVARAVASAPIPGLARRVAQRVEMKLGRRSWDRDCVVPFERARAAVLGEEAAGPPRFLVRVDEFPHSSALDRPDIWGTDNFERFHAIMTEARVPYLLAVPPFTSLDPTDPGGTVKRAISDEDVEVLRAVERDGVAFAYHGLDHRTRLANPRRHSEFAGLSPSEMDERLEHAESLLAQLGIRSTTFVPPYNRFDTAHYDVLARRYEVVCGGPETVPSLGFHRTPLWRGDAVYMPAYTPLYGRAGEVEGGAAEMIERQAALWSPVVLHWGWESRDGWGALERLAKRLRGFAVAWEGFLEAVRGTR